MRRREFITLLGGAAATWPLAARAQQPDRMRRIGVLMPYAENDQALMTRVATLQAGLRDLGWTEGRNIRIDYRYAPTAELIKTYAAELVRLTPDVLIANTNLVTVTLQRETHAIPIIFIAVADPIGEGLIVSVAQPGGNITGFTSFEVPIAGKWLSLLKEIAPDVRRIGFLYDPEIHTNVDFVRVAESAAPSFNVKVFPLGVRDAAEIERAITAFAVDSNSGLVVVSNPVTNSNHDLTVGLAARYRLPATYPHNFYVTAGGLVSYGPDLLDMWRRAPSYVDRILKGTKPADLPIQQPIKFELVINMKTAKTLGLDVPLHLQQLADEVIE
jgi:putative tryptophan/tyrosine transport system substrate-binding protein